MRENLCNSFPEKPLSEIIEIEKKFYQGFCDLVVETIKSFSISKTELQKRFLMTTHGNTHLYFDQNINIMGAAAHLGNWEWLNFASALEMKHNFYGIYKPLSQVYFNHLLTRNRARFKTNLLATKSLKLIYEELTKTPYGIAVVADQAPHYYPKALVVNFLNQKNLLGSRPRADGCTKRNDASLGLGKKNWEISIRMGIRLLRCFKAIGRIF